MRFNRNESSEHIQAAAQRLFDAVEAAYTEMLEAGKADNMLTNFYRDTLALALTGDINSDITHLEQHIVL